MNCALMKVSVGMTLHIITKKTPETRTTPTKKKPTIPKKLKPTNLLKNPIFLIRSCWWAAVFCCRDDCISLPEELLFILSPICISHYLGTFFYYLVKNFIVYLCFNSFKQLILWLRQEVVKLDFFNINKRSTCMFYDLVSESTKHWRP